MSRTHHATRTWRLSCGCLRDYPGMPLGKTHHVLCVACRTPVTTLYPYEENRCAFTTTARRAEDDKLMHVSCTEAPGNDRCEAGVHYDRNVQMKFRNHARLKATRDGHTGHA
jgi:hypothetical protein